MKRSPLQLIALATCGGILTIGSLTQAQDKGPAIAANSTPAATKKFEMPACEVKEDKGKVTKREVKANPKARAAAQKGLNFLATNTAAWQQQHNCYGCHVQAVTLEAFAVGTKHKYEISTSSYKTVLDGLTTIDGGTRTEQGLQYAHGHTLMAPSKAFGGAALARHDQWVDQKMSDDLLQTAAELLTFQKDDGYIELGWTNPPVGVGGVQGAYQAIQTWQQSYARSADGRWLTAVQRSEKFLHKTLEGWKQQPPSNIQDVNYMVLGLLAAGVGTTERSITELQSLLIKLQNSDGGWGFGIQQGAQVAKPAKGAKSDRRDNDIFPEKYAQMASDQTSSPYATGQVLYTLRMLGMTDDHPAVAKGTDWLIAKQQAEGGWSAAGFGKAEAMWGVLGLVSLDVLSVSVHGIKYGQRVVPTQPIGAEAWDNSGAKVVKIEVSVDDLLLYGACGDNLVYDWDTSGMTTGKHIVDVTATNSRGTTSRQRLEVYAGDIFLTQLGTKYSDNGTLITLRNIAPADMKGAVEAQLMSTKEVKGVPTADSALVTLKEPSAQGAMSFFWNGKDAKGKALATGEKYIARLVFRDEQGKVRQTEEVLFVHDTYEAQRERYGEVTGGINFADGKRGSAANAEVELVDEKGNVVQTTRSTASGQYRFKSVDANKKYKLRVKKDGYKAAEQEVQAAPAAQSEAKADFMME
jgi:hypothetical protein